MFSCRVSSRRDLRKVTQTKIFHENWCRLSGARTDSVAHPDTMIYLLKNIDNNQLAMVAPAMLKDHIRSKRMSEAFLYNHLMIAVDGVCTFSSHERHCDECIVMRHKDGTSTYLHYVLEAKVISRNGSAFSIMSEPIANPAGKSYEKQDCELKAFKRLAPRLKAAFPRMNIVLIADSLYACAPFFKICAKNRWEFIVTFKRGSIPTLFDEALTLLPMESQNIKESKDEPISKRWRWLDNLEYVAGKSEFNLGFIEYQEKGKDKDAYFVWLTSFRPDGKNVTKLTKGGRLRWKIENEGFNEQKNGYNLKHLCCCSNPNALFGLYLLLQIAHILMQLLAKSNIVEGFETLRFLASLLLESLRNETLQEYLFAAEIPRMQIRDAPS